MILLAGLTLVELAAFAASVNGGALSLIKIREELFDHGSTDPVGHAQSITDAAKALAIAINAALPVPLK